MGFIKKAQTGTGRFIQVIGWIIFIGTGLAAFIWELWALSIAFGAWTIIVALLFAPITYLAAVIIVWIATGAFPIIVLILWLASWLGMGIIALGSRVSGDDYGNY